MLIVRIKDEVPMSKNCFSVIEHHKFWGRNDGQPHVCAQPRNLRKNDHRYRGWKAGKLFAAMGDDNTPSVFDWSQGRVLVYASGRRSPSGEMPGSVIEAAGCILSVKCSINHA